jgi:hypothetical protein
MKKAYVAKNGNVAVPVWKCQAKKNGRKYQYFALADYSSGKRKIWTSADLEKATAKADTIADAQAAGEKPLLLKPTDRACISAALELVSAPEVLIAVRSWLDSRPTKFTPTPLGTAIDKYLAGRTGRSASAAKPVMRVCWVPS